MKTIGLLGGMSWESTTSYYRLLNEETRSRLGGLHSACLCLYSLDFQPLETMQHEGDWDGITDVLVSGAERVAAAGAEMLLLCTNTMHKVAPQLEAALEIPLLHIADATAQQLQADGITRVGLLGTRFTMEEAFYRTRVEDRFDIEVLVPPEPQRKEVHRIIYEELCQGHIVEDSRHRLLAIVAQLSAAGAQGVILGCTEIALLIQQAHTEVKLYDSTTLHCQAALNQAIAGDPTPSTT